VLEVDFVPLNVSLRKRLIDRLTSVQCNGQKAVTTPYLIGIGPALPLYTSWAVAQSGLASKVKYYASTSKEAKENLASHDEDFGTTNDGLSPKWLSLISDVAIMPAAVFAIAPGTSRPTHQACPQFDCGQQLRCAWTDIVCACVWPKGIMCQSSAITS
jgi:hypothetical protein